MALVRCGWVSITRLGDKPRGGGELSHSLEILVCWNHWACLVRSCKPLILWIFWALRYQQRRRYMHIFDIIKCASARLFMLQHYGVLVCQLKTWKVLTWILFDHLLNMPSRAWHPGLSEQKHAALERIQKWAQELCFKTSMTFMLLLYNNANLQSSVCLNSMDKLMKNHAYCS